MNTKVCDLEAQLALANGAQRINLLNELGHELRFTDPARALSLAEKAAQLAEKTSDLAGKAHSLRLQGWCHYQLGELKKALAFSQQALALAIELNDKKLQSKALNTIGVVHKSQGQYPQALENYHRCLDLQREIDDLQGIANSLNNIALTYFTLGDYPQALDYLQQSLSLYQQIQDPSGEARALMNLGTVYGELEMYDKARESFQKNLEFRRSHLNDRRGEGLALHNLGIICSELQEYDQALDYYRQSIEISQVIGDTFLEAVSRHNMGNTLRDLRRFDEALEAHQHSLNLRQQMGDLDGLSYSLQNLGELYGNPEVEFYDPVTALDYLYQALAIAQEQGSLSRQCEVHLVFSTVYQHVGDIDHAFEHHQKYHQLWVQLHNEKSTQALANLQAVHQTEQAKKEAEIYRLRNVELAQLVEQLRELVHEKTEIMGIVSHDLKNPLAAIMGLIDMLLRDDFQLSAEKERECKQNIKKISKRMLEMIVQLLDANQLDTGQMELTPTPFDIIMTLHMKVEEFRLRAAEKSIELQFLPEWGGVEVYADEAAVERVLDNLISNAIKYSPPDTTVTVQVKPGTDTVCISVQDQGQGLTEADQQKLFGKFQRLSAQPTGGEHSTGLGLSIVKKLVEAMGGQVWAESAGKDQGSTFFVELPAAK
ncbi:MAG: hypothetical protein D6675_10740 [Gemmatimonadetes bacterium]|nr:MAG: hypothetical protein D6675_10740 [Gemmatimonadota bacterium]